MCSLWSSGLAPLQVPIPAPKQELAITSRISFVAHDHQIFREGLLKLFSVPVLNFFRPMARLRRRFPFVNSGGNRNSRNWFDIRVSLLGKQALDALRL